MDHGTVKNQASFNQFDFFALDLLALIGSFIVAYVYKFRDFSFCTSLSWKSILIICCLLDAAYIFFTGPFRGILTRQETEELLATAQQAIYNFILCCIVLYVLKAGAFFSRTVVILTYSFYLVVSFALRTAWKKILIGRQKASFAGAAKSIFVVGSRQEMPGLLRSIGSDFLKEYEVKGICLTDGVPGEKVETGIDVTTADGRVKTSWLNYQNTADLSDFVPYVLSNHIEEVFIGTNPGVVSPEDYRQLIENGKIVHLGIQSMIGFAAGDQKVTTVGTYRALGVGMYSVMEKQMTYLAVKRVLDVLFSLVGLILLLPLTAAVKLAALLSGDRKPIFYTQKRVGLQGKVFKMLKFRTMVPDAEERLQDLLQEEAYRTEWEQKQKFEEDPRITPLGRFLRKTSLDEMPQFLNVLKGDMAVIGPRPLVPGELEQHRGLQLYNCVKPGITGWWSCNGRSNTTYEERLSLEYYYVKNCSFYLDMMCFIKTIAAILKTDGAQ